MLKLCIGGCQPATTQSMVQLPEMKKNRAVRKKKGGWRRGFAEAEMHPDMEPRNWLVILFQVI